METKIARYISLVLLLAVLSLAWSCKDNEGQELFVTDKALGSGGIAYWVFDCDGELARPEDIEFYNSLCDSDIIYENLPGIE